MKTKFFNGMQSVFVAELLKEGASNAIDKMISEAGTNALLLFTHHDYITAKDWNIKLTHTESKDTEIEGFWFEIDPKYYENTIIKPIKTKTPGLENRDAFGEIARVAKEKGLEVYALNMHRPAAVHHAEEYDKYEELHMRTVNGQKVPAVLCQNQPEVKKFYKAYIDNLDDKYGDLLDGFCLGLLDHYALFGFETLTDELADTLGIKRFSNPEMGLSCFCNVCVKQAKEQGIDVEKIKKGLLKGIELGYIPEKIERMSKADEAFRFLLDIPEYLEWLRFRSAVHTEAHKDLYEYIKNINSDYKIGLDIYGAKDDWKYQTKFNELAKYCDWIKPMYYSSTYEGPLTSKDIGEGVKLAKSLTDKPIYPGVLSHNFVSKEDIEEGINYSIKNGADGIVLSWDYAAVPFENMNVAKNELKELDMI